ncbi:MAG: hypothetical protein ACJ8IR_12685 [Alphaproteobacteria bacterium]
MTYAECYSERLNRVLAELKFGTLRFWGVWFGKPNDNVHGIVGSNADRNLLRIQFDQGETLTVAEPNGLKASSSVFSIRDASRVRWEWFYYGRPPIPANRYFMEFKRGEAGISNVDWYEPDLSTSLSFSGCGNALRTYAPGLP